MDTRNRQHERRTRRAVAAILAVVLLAAILAVLAFAVKAGDLLLVRTQLQAAADSAATAAAANLGNGFVELLTAAREDAGGRTAGAGPVQVKASDVELGVWDPKTRSFKPAAMEGNAVRVTTRRDASTGGMVPAFFAHIVGPSAVETSASAVAVAGPRDLAFVVDLSGSMNDDTEPCRATDGLHDASGPEGCPAVADERMQRVYDDFGYGAYPGAIEYLGEPWGVRQDKYAYAELTRNGGPLTDRSVPKEYRITPSDNEASRKRKAYSAIIDGQIARVMPDAVPMADSSVNYDAWEKYLDYLIEPCRIVPGGPGGPPDDRGWLPYDQDRDRIDGFGNSGGGASREVGGIASNRLRNKIGYLTYVQFMMDHGRELRLRNRHYVPLSKHSPHCPWHTESTAGGTFRFPPREQPMHAVRRALIAALEILDERNQTVSDPARRDWVAIISFDRLNDGGPVVEQSLTHDYRLAMQACSTLQAVGDRGASSAIEAGLVTAGSHLRPRAEGGRGRRFANKVVVLLTDGHPDLYVSDPSGIDEFLAEHPSEDFYRDGDYAYDACLMQAAAMRQAKCHLFPVDTGGRAHDDFMDRLARMAGTGDAGGQSLRAGGNPAECEQRLTAILQEIITSPPIRLVQ